MTSQSTIKADRPIDPVTGEPSERRKDPAARLQFACGHLPSKRAFREAAVALRALIRKQRRSGESSDDYLRELYRFATLFGLVHPPKPQRGEGSVGNAARWDEVESLDLPYAEVGYDKLSLLNKTDRKWFVEAWGEPNNHVLPVARRAVEKPTAEPASPTKAPSAEPEEVIEEVYRPPTAASVAAALAPKPRHKYEGGAVPVPESAEDPVYDLMERLGKPSGRQKKRLLKKALVITGFSADE